MPSRPFTRRWLRIHACAREIELDKIVAIVKQLSSETVPEGDKVMTAETLQASQLERLAGRAWPGAPALLHRGGVVQGGYPAGAVGPDQPAHPGVRRGGPPARPAGRGPAPGRRGARRPGARPPAAACRPGPDASGASPGRRDHLAPPPQRARSPPPPPPPPPP